VFLTSSCSSPSRYPRSLRPFPTRRSSDLASARALGAEAVIIERMDRVLARVASQTLSTFFTDLHRRHGVEILTGAEVAGFEDGGDRKSTRLNSSHVKISYAVFCLKKKTIL